jgi:hypothetical protein
MPASRSFAAVPGWKGEVLAYEPVEEWASITSAPIRT